MALVSGLYRMAASEWAGGEDERRVRLKLALRRLHAIYGPDEVESRLRAYRPTGYEDTILHQTLLLAAGR